MGFWAWVFWLGIYGLIFGRMGITGFWEYGFEIFWAKIYGSGFGLGIFGLIFVLGVLGLGFLARIWANGFHRLLGRGVS